MELKNIPNLLSIIRICLVFVFVYVLFVLGMPLVAIAIFLLAGITDIVDGFLARKYNWITNLGKILDPFADKLMQCTVLVCLCILEYIPIWFVLPYFIKEIATLMIGFIVIKRRNVLVVSKWYGKAAVCLTYAAIILCVLLKYFGADNELYELYKTVICLPSVAFAIFAFVAYVVHYSTLKKNEIEKGKIRDVIK